MDYLSALAISLALSMDAMAVSVTCGMNHRKHKIQRAILTAFLFGIFQMLMPVLGWSIGKVGSGIVAEFDHIIAFLILLFLGAKMILDAKKQDMNQAESDEIKNLIFLAVATSIDALASGMILPVSVKATTPFYMFQAVLMIGTVTFILSFLGYCAGERFSRIKPQYADIIGGLMLIIIGIKTLLTG